MSSPYECALCGHDAVAVAGSGRDVNVILASHLAHCGNVRLEQCEEIDAGRWDDRDRQRRLAQWVWQHWKKGVGRRYCVVDAKWYRMWLLFVGLDGTTDGEAAEALKAAEAGPRPARIDNSVLLSPKDDEAELMDEEGDGGGGSDDAAAAADDLRSSAPRTDLLSGAFHIRIGLREHWDYETVPLPLGVLLYRWYGGGPVLIRSMVGVGNVGAQLQVSLHPITLDIRTRAAGGVGRGLDSHREQRTMEFSRQAKITDVMHILAREMNAPPHKLKLFTGEYDVQGHLHEEAVPREMMRTTIEDMGLADMQVVIVEKEAPSSFVDPHAYPNYTSYSTSTTYRRYVAQNEPGDPIQRGVCGLHNLGNTCFMNSTLQCLSATMPVALQFLGKDPQTFKKAKKSDTKGKMVVSFASFIGDVWGGRLKKIVPRAIKTVISEYAPQFSGYQQHDAHEFLSYLLNSLHQDMNEFAAEDTGAEETAEQDLASSDAAMWTAHTEKNQSPIVDLFHGQLRSSILCSGCESTFTRYDAYACLNLPVPSHPYRRMEVIFFPLNGMPTKYGVSVAKAGQIRNMKMALSESVGVPPERMVATEMYHNRAFEAPDGKRLFDIHRSDIVCIHELVESDGPVEHIMVVNRRPYERYHSDRGGDGKDDVTWRVFGTPFVVSYPEGTATDVVLASIHQRVTTYVQRTDIDITVRKVLVSGDHTGEELLPTDDVMVKEEDKILSVDWAEKDAPDVLYSEDRVVVDESVHVKEKELVVDLSDCLREFSSSELLDGANAWHCPRCNEHRPVTKRMEMWRLPPVLVINLSRFHFDQFLREKVTTKVEFPLEGLQPYQFVPETHPQHGTDSPYDLVGVVEHQGGLSSGHYVSRTRSALDGKWYTENDSHVSEADPDVIVNRSAYVLFYRQRPADAAAEVAQLPPVCEGVLTSSTEDASEGQARETGSGAAVADSSAAHRPEEAGQGATSGGGHKRPRPGQHFQPTRRPHSREEATGKANATAVDDANSNIAGDAMDVALDDMDDRGVQVMGPMPTSDLARSLYLCPYCQVPCDDLTALSMHMLDAHGDASLIS